MTRMQGAARRVLVPVLAVGACLAGTSRAEAEIGCPAGPIDLQHGEWLVINTPCTIAGGITMDGSSLLVVTGTEVLVQGDVTLQGAAVMSVQDSTLAFDSTFNKEHQVATSGTSVLHFRRAIVKTSLSGSNFLVAHFAGADSRLVVEDSSLQTTSDWFITYLIDRASVLADNAQWFPSEVVVSANATAVLANGTRTGLWMIFWPGSKAGMLLPDQRNGAYSWAFGRTTPGVVNVGFQVHIAASNVRLHARSNPNTDIAIVGRGIGSPEWGEISIGYVVKGAASPLSISSLEPGHVPFAQFTDQGRNLRLFNVQLDSLGWQVYVEDSPGPVIIRDSILNEAIAIASNVEIEDSVLQLAFLAALNGGSMTVRRSHVFSQFIHGESGGHVRVEDSFVHGSVLEANDGSRVDVVGQGMLLPNGDGTGVPCVGEVVSPLGIPRCNPFIDLGALPAVIATGTGVVETAITPPPAVADLQIVGFSDSPSVAVSQLFTHQAEAGNAGPDPATGVALLFRTPPGAVVEAIPPGCAPAGLDVACAVGDLPVFTGTGFYAVAYRAVRAGVPAGVAISVIANEPELHPHNNDVVVTTHVQ